MYLGSPRKAKHGKKQDIIFKIEDEPWLEKNKTAAVKKNNESAETQKIIHKHMRIKISVNISVICNTMYYIL